MNRVIVDALASGPNPAPSTYMNMAISQALILPPTALTSSETTAATTSTSLSSEIHNHMKIVNNITNRVSPERIGGLDGAGPSEGTRNVQLHPMTPPRLIPAAAMTAAAEKSDSSNNRIEITAESLREAESQSNMAIAPPATVAPKLSTTVVPVAASSSSQVGSSLGAAVAVASGAPSSAVVEPSPNAAGATPIEEDIPLNLSSSRVLQTSNQQIIDHFIDKLLNTGGECGEGA